MAASAALEAFVAELIPSDDLPGAAEAGTAASVRAVLAAQPPLAALAVAGFEALDRGRSATRAVLGCAAWAGAGAVLRQRRRPPGDRLPWPSRRPRRLSPYDRRAGRAPRG